MDDVHGQTVKHQGLASGGSDEFDKGVVKKIHVFLSAFAEVSAQNGDMHQL